MEDDKKIKKYIAEAIEAGKSETDSLVDKVMTKIDSKIGESVERYVNGHLRDIKKHLTEQDETLQKLIQDTDPLVDGKKALTASGKFIMWIGGISAAIYAFLKLIR